MVRVYSLFHLFMSLFFLLQIIENCVLQRKKFVQIDLIMFLVQLHFFCNYSLCKIVFFLVLPRIPKGNYLEEEVHTGTVV